MVMLSYALTMGVPSAWMSVLNFSLYQLGMSQVGGGGGRGVMYICIYFIIIIVLSPSPSPFSH